MSQLEEAGAALTRLAPFPTCKIFVQSFHACDSIHYVDLNFLSICSNLRDVHRVAEHG